MSTISNIEKMIEQIIIKNKDLESKINILIERTNTVKEAKNLELVAAKIIKEAKSETRIVSSETSLTAFPPDGKYSYPNFNVGNTELGSSGNPEALPCPQRSNSNKGKLKLLES